MKLLRLLKKYAIPSVVILVVAFFLYYHIYYKVDGFQSTAVGAYNTTCIKSTVTTGSCPTGYTFDTHTNLCSKITGYECDEGYEKSRDNQTKCDPIDYDKTQSKESIDATPIYDSVPYVCPAGKISTGSSLKCNVMGKMLCPTNRYFYNGTLMNSNVTKCATSCTNSTTCKNQNMNTKNYRSTPYVCR